MNTRLSKLGLTHILIYRVYIYDFYYTKRSLFVINRLIDIIFFISVDN